MDLLPLPLHRHPLPPLHRQCETGGPRIFKPSTSFFRSSASLPLECFLYPLYGLYTLPLSADLSGVIRHCPNPAQI